MVFSLKCSCLGLIACPMSQDPVSHIINSLQINNAGMGRNNAGLFDGKTSSWVEMISTNVLGPCMCTREAIQVQSL